MGTLALGSAVKTKHGYAKARRLGISWGLLPRSEVLSPPRALQGDGSTPASISCGVARSCRGSVDSVRSFRAPPVGVTLGAGVMPARGSPATRSVNVIVHRSTRAPSGYETQPSCSAQSDAVRGFARAGGAGEASLPHRWVHGDHRASRQGMDDGVGEEWPFGGCPTLRRVGRGANLDHPYFGRPALLERCLYVSDA